MNQCYKPLLNLLSAHVFFFPTRKVSCHFQFAIILLNLALNKVFFKRTEIPWICELRVTKWMGGICSTNGERRYFACKISREDT